MRRVLGQPVETAERPVGAAEERQERPQVQGGSGGKGGGTKARTFSPPVTVST